VAAEGITLMGSAKERADLCRAVPSLSAQRQAWVLQRLLRAPEETVRISAIAACAVCPPRDELDDLVEGLLRDPGASNDIRTKAAGVLLSRKPVRESVLDWIDESSRDSDFRGTHPLLITHAVAQRLPDASEQELSEILDTCMDSSDPAAEYLRPLVRDHVERFRPLRQRFLDAIEADVGFERRRFALSCLSALDGGMRGQNPEDWLDAPVPLPDEDECAAFEAEWVQDIRPNYQIADVRGLRCLVLGEGAGGYMSWLKGEDATVDIGTARFSLFAPHEGFYTLWVRVWLDDKCGNSFGLWLGRHQFENFEDRRSTLGQWHWLPLYTRSSPRVHLDRGFHEGRLQAWEDGVYIDRLALLPSDQRPDEDGPAPAVRWDPSLISSLSFSVERQSQARGTEQEVTVWVRRNRPEMAGGTLSLSLPPPFAILGPEEHRVRFSEGNPLARTTFRVWLPQDAVGGEGYLRAVYDDDSGEVAEGQMILGAQFDWLTTGPMTQRSSRFRELANASNVTDEGLPEGWEPFPLDGYDTYRRLDMERAWGELRDCFIYLCADIDVQEEGDYLGLLTADDTAIVYLDGRPLIGQVEGGPGEGRMISRRVHLKAGRQRLFARVYQADLPEPQGRDRLRESPNRCNFKLLLRKTRYQPAEAIETLPMPRAGG
jgi:hypothetical protein